MKISAAFPSNYVKAADLDGKPRIVTIRTCVLEDLGQGNERERKPVLYFDKAQKGLVLNKTNANTVADAYGDDTAAWEGRSVEIFPTPVEYKGKMVDGIRLRVKAAAPPSVAPPATPPPAAAPMDDELNDEIPW